MHQSALETDLAPEEHLERDWQLFQAVETSRADALFRTWEVTAPVVVVGRSSAVDAQVNLAACEEDAVRVVRRFSGGGAVVLAAGCLNFSVAVALARRPSLADVAGSFPDLLRPIAAALGVAGLSVGGGTDLVLDGRKVSGNAQRRGRRALLHHGTLLYDFDARLASRYLKEPLRQPAYRAGRPHTEFLGNIPLPGAVLRSRLTTVFGVPQCDGPR